MKKVGILGGSFDPPHYGHLALAKTALETFDFTKVLMLLTPDPPHKTGRNLTSFELRKQMLEIFISDRRQFEISTIEAEREGPHYTLDTIRLLKERNSDVEYWLIIGSDTFRNLHTWYKPEQILKEVKICVGLRSGFDISEDIGLDVFSVPLKDISSTKIREFINIGESVDNLTSRGIISFIELYRLYKGDI